MDVNPIFDAMRQAREDATVDESLNDEIVSWGFFYAWMIAVILLIVASCYGGWLLWAVTAFYYAALSAVSFYVLYLSFKG